MTNNLGRALVVEDDHSWQQILSENLVDIGLQVDVADGLEMALTFLRTQSYRIAVVDLSLSGQDAHNQDGLRVLEFINQVDPNCISMLVTGFATVELAVSVLTEYHAFTCLRKETFQRSQFRELIQQALVHAQTKKHQSLDEAKAKSIEDHSGAVISKPQKDGLVLVVEDDAGWRSILAELLLDDGYQIRLCSGFGEALSYLRREKYILAVVDLSLSGHSGKGVEDWNESATGLELEGYRLLTSTRAVGIPTLVVSGVAKPEDIERAYEEKGIFAYLEKQTFDRHAFIHLVQEAELSRRSTRDLDVLTDRERDVLALLSQGMTNKEIAEVLVISSNTVKRHTKSIFGKLDIHTRSAAAARVASR